MTLIFIFIRHCLSTNTVLPSMKYNISKLIIILFRGAVTIFIVMSSFFIIYADNQTNITLKLMCFYICYYIINIVIIYIRLIFLSKSNWYIQIKLRLIPYRIEMYLLAFTINIIYVIYKADFIESFFNTFTLLIIFDMLIDLTIILKEQKSKERLHAFNKK